MTDHFFCPIILTSLHFVLVITDDTRWASKLWLPSVAWRSYQLLWQSDSCLKCYYRVYKRTHTHGDTEWYKSIFPLFIMKIYWTSTIVLNCAAYCHLRSKLRASCTCCFVTISFINSACFCRWLRRLKWEWVRLWNFHLLQTFLFHRRPCSNFRDQF